MASPVMILLQLSLILQLKTLFINSLSGGTQVNNFEHLVLDPLIATGNEATLRQNISIDLFDHNAPSSALFYAMTYQLNVDQTLTVGTMTVGKISASI